MKKRSKKTNPPAEVIVNNNTTLSDENECNEQCNNSIPQVSDAGENEYSDKQNDSISDSNIHQKNDIAWPDEDLNELLTRIEKCIPGNDTLSYNKRVEKLNWDQVAFSRYSGDQCRQQWVILQKQVRRFRLLSEILVDAKEWVRFPRRKKTNIKNPDLPRKPRTSYMIFYLKKKSKILREHPGIGAHEITKIAAQMYKTLTPEKKGKYDTLAAQEREEYLTKIQQYYEQHPELKPKAPERVTKSLKTKLPRNNRGSNVSKDVASVKSVKDADVKPLKPKNPFQYYLADELEKLGNSKDVDKNAFKEDCKEKWKNMSDKKKMFWINWTEKCEAEYEEQLKAYIQSHPTFIPQPHKSLLNKEETLLKERIAGKPTKPPNSAYSLFSKRYLSSEEIKSVDPKERMNCVSIKWKTLSDDEKRKYQEEVTKSVREYKVAFDSYIQSLPEDKRQEELDKAAPKRKHKPSDEKNEQNPKRRRTERTKVSKMKFKEPEQPPISAYKYFSNIYKGSTPSTAWKALSSTERKKYEDELMEKKREYIENFERFLKSLTKEQLEEYSKAKKQIAKDDEDVDEEEEEDDDSSNSSSSSEESEEENDENLESD